MAPPSLARDRTLGAGSREPSLFEAGNEGMLDMLVSYSVGLAGDGPSQVHVTGHTKKVHTKRQGHEDRTLINGPGTRSSWFWF